MLSLIKNFFVALLALITVVPPFGDTQLPERKCAPEFSGTFLQSWMSSSWDRERWASEVDCMERDGVKYLVLQDLANMDADGNWTVYYNSTIPAFDDATYGSDVVKSALEACKGTDIKIFLGLTMFDSFWSLGNLTGEYTSVCDITADMLEDIYDTYYSISPENFYGWYFTLEINNQINCGPFMSKMVKGFNSVLNRATEVDPALPMMISPYTANYLDLGDVATYSQWLTFFEHTAFRDGDIVAPQDAVGADWIEEDDLVRIWEMYSSASKKAKADIRLWANCENFDIATGPSILGGTIGRPETENIEFESVHLAHLGGGRHHKQRSHDDSHRRAYTVYRKFSHCSNGIRHYFPGAANSRSRRSSWQHSALVPPQPQIRYVLRCGSCRYSDSGCHPYGTTRRRGSGLQAVQRQKVFSWVCECFVLLLQRVGVGRYCRCI